MKPVQSCLDNSMHGRGHAQQHVPHHNEAQPPQHFMVQAVPAGADGHVSKPVKFTKAGQPPGKPRARCAWCVQQQSTARAQPAYLPSKRKLGLSMELKILSQSYCANSSHSVRTATACASWQAS